jgi:ribose 5-phosphate isomerase
MVYMALGEVAGAFSVALGLGGGEGAAAFIERDAEKAAVELEEHAVSSWETREANTLEELEVSRGRRAVL